MLALKAPQDRTVVETGHTRGSIGYAVAAHCLKSRYTIVLARAQEVERIAAEVELWAQAKGEKIKTVVLPSLPYDEPEDDEALMLQHQEKRLEILGVLGEITSTLEANERLAIITDMDGLAQPLPPRQTIASINIRVGGKVSIEGLKNKLSTELGYSNESVCEAPGQYAIRGGIVDIYPVSATAPVRLDFAFGNEVEAIKIYDPTTQRSETKIDSISIAPARVDSSWRSGALREYMPAVADWVILEPAELEATGPTHWHIPEKIKTPEGHFASFVARPNDRWLALMTITASSTFIDTTLPLRRVRVESPARYRPIPPAGLIGEDRAKAEQEILRKFVANVRQISQEAAASVYVFHRGDVGAPIKKIIKPLAPQYISGAIAEGAIIYTDGVPTTIALAPGDLPPYASVYSLSRAGRRVARHSAVNELLDFSSVAEGDYLVHLEHGICLYRGIGRMDDGTEVLSLEFDEGMRLHLRFSEAHLISRYVGLSKKKPKLNRLGSATWARAKQNAKAATMDYAAELLRLHAVRMSQPGFAFGPQSDIETQFDSTFPYRLTADQAKAIEATKTDMMQPRPMDRLLCGDVGFGKTEVALRAVIKAAAYGKQAAIMCPTTILSEQHYRTFRERAEGFGVTVECLNRFRSHSTQHAIIKALAEGRIDVVVGTHRLLSRDVVFKDLGLIVIDEEHRFGVEQKEQLKRLRTSVDVLSMSATPIPRTLQMSLGGARDLSIIETAPQNRRPIETIVRTFDEKTLHEAIDYEIKRGGQVFYMHNRVRTIARTALRLQEMFPRLRIAIGHGQMHEEELERVMAEFVAGQYDILVCTTIIESGLDIPNCNTIIIESADQFGLAQLYQIRGRVGRFNRQAYAYLFLHPRKNIESDAKARLEALRQHNELGAGFKIALRDLELRGSGNLLGAQQSGHIAGVGFELYCQLLKESVARLRSSSHTSGPYIPRATVRLDWALDTAIPTSYLAEPRLRLELNRSLAIAETLPALEDIGQGIIDRFGQPPMGVQNLLEINRLRIMAQTKGIATLATEGTKIIAQRIEANGDLSYIKIGSLFPRLVEGTPTQKMAALKAFVAGL